jgi:hypothetical protein
MIVATPTVVSAAHYVLEIGPNLESVLIGVIFIIVIFIILIIIAIRQL